jgi:hypothetical protein
LPANSKERLKAFAKRLLRPASAFPPKPRPLFWREWSIGIYQGSSPFCLASPDGVANPVLTREHVTDVPSLFVADPFMIQVDRQWHMFFEVWNERTKRGEIGLAISNDATVWTYKQIVLAEPFHLSYPYVFHWKNDHYMVPETFETNSIRLYRATRFPEKWSFVQTLIEGKPYVDSSLVFFNDRWWLFTGWGLPPYRADTLHLYFARNLPGPWKEHWKSPVITNNVQIARPAGRVLILDGKVIRYAQDCDGGYGLKVRAFEIQRLTPWWYRERERNESPVLKASGTGWNASGMHHIDPHHLDDGRWIASVDGQIASKISS